MIISIKEIIGRRLPGVAAVILLISFCSEKTWAQEPQPVVQAGEAIAEMSKDQESVKMLLQANWVKNWVAKVDELPTINPSKVTVGEKEVAVD